MKALSLFSGIGGLDLAAEACGITPVAMCEIEPFPVAILQKRFPRVPILPDVRKVNGHDYRGAIDVVFGGFPCQDLSLAGKRAGLIDGEGNVTRSGLWFEMLRIISEARPRFVVAENVRGAIDAALDVVQGGLEGEGYEVRIILLPASAVGAPHQRERVFIIGVRGDILDLERSPAERMADADDERLQGTAHASSAALAGAKSDDEQSAGCDRMRYWRTPDANADRGAMSEELYQRRVRNGEPININAQVAHVTREAQSEGHGQLNPAWVEQLMGYPDGWTDPDCDEPVPWAGWPARPGEQQYPYEHPRTVVGMPNRAKRLKALGNSVVPQQAEPIFRTIQFIDYMIGEEA